LLVYAEGEAGLISNAVPSIYITGASCSGVTTLGRLVASALNIRHVDCDDFYWYPTNPPFSTKRPPEDRVRLIREALGDEGWVLSGSFDGWGDSLIEGIDLIVFIYTPTPIRMERLLTRERERYGNRILPSGDMYEIHTAFAAWAAQYDKPDFPGRNLARHQAWLKEQTAVVLRLDGTQEPHVLISRVLSELHMHGTDRAVDGSWHPSIGLGFSAPSAHITAALTLDSARLNNNGCHYSGITSLLFWSRQHISTMMTGLIDGFAFQTFCAAPWLLAFSDVWSRRQLAAGLAAVGHHGRNDGRYLHRWRERDPYFAVRQARGGQGENSADLRYVDPSNVRALPAPIFKLLSQLISAVGDAPMNSANDKARQAPSDQDVFLNAWQTYRKVLTNNLMFYNEVYSLVRSIITEEIARPFCLPRYCLRRRAGLI
jgi:adenylate kinase family enzyme